MYNQQVSNLPWCTVQLSSKPLQVPLRQAELPVVWVIVLRRNDKKQAEDILSAKHARHIRINISSSEF